MNEKPLYVSKTFWVNVVAGIALGVNFFTGTVKIDSEAQVEMVGIIWAAVNLIIRLKTNTSVR